MSSETIQNEADYLAILARIETLMDAEPGTPEEDLLAHLAMLADNYEKEHFPIGPPDPVEAIKFRMEQEGLDCKDLPATDS